MPLVALILGTAALGSEIEDGTVVYLLIKPIPRWLVAFAKILVAVAADGRCSSSRSTLLTGLLIGGTGSESLDDHVRVRRRLRWSAASAYASVFVALSALTSRALIIGLAYVLIWEGVSPACWRGRGSCRSARRRSGSWPRLGGERSSGDAAARPVSVGGRHHGRDRRRSLAITSGGWPGSRSAAATDRPLTGLDGRRTGYESDDKRP